MEKAREENGTENLSKYLFYRNVGRRAVDAAIWGMPAVNYYLMYNEMVHKLNGGDNQILFWSHLLNWKNQTLTPNSDVIYFIPFFNTEKVGPVVLEVPPADEGLLNGSVMNLWQAAIEDIGPGGVDKGKGGKYLILPPGYDLANVPDGYIPMACDTYRGYALIRSIMKNGSEDDAPEAMEYGKRLKLYPLSQADKPGGTKFLDAVDVKFDSKIPYDLQFFEILNQLIQDEPFLDRDRLMIDPLKTIGIEKGKKFDPDDTMIDILENSIKETHALLDSMFDQMAPYYPGKNWFFPVTEEFHQNLLSYFSKKDSYPIDTRAIAYTFAFFSAKHIGEAQYYLMCTKDSAGNDLKGSNHYRIHVPENMPVTQYWSLTVYNRRTHTFIENLSHTSRSSQTPGLFKNGDGSVDIFVGPDAPSGVQSNWIPSDPNGNFEILARFYGPKKELFDKTWQLDDIEEMKIQ